MVCQTGLNTVMGKTIRELLVPTKLAKTDPVVVVCFSDHSSGLLTDASSCLPARPSAQD